MYVRTYVRVYACIHVCMYTCMHVYMYACMHVCMYVCTRGCISNVAMYTRRRSCSHTHIHTRAHTHTHTHTAREMGWAQPIDPKPLHSRLGAFEEAFDAQTAVCLIPNP